MTARRAVQLYSKTLSGLCSTPSTLLRALLQYSPSILKFFVGLLFLFNIRSWPLVWHYNVLIRPVYELRFRWWAVWWRNVFASKKRMLQVMDKFLKDLCPVGEDPLSYTVTVKQWAGPDDCDFNWHLSNSSYPKQLDAARFRAALKICPTFFRAGGWMPLGATHFKFISEIPILAHYEMRMSMAAWDNKWLYTVIRFVTTKKSKSKKPQVTASAASREKPIPSGDSAPFPQLHTPATPSGTSTPALTDGAAPSNPAERIAQLLPEEPDGATLHCISVCELCFKIGRITVPPAVALALEGFSAPPPPESGITKYSHEHPPPNFIKSQQLQAPDVPHGHLRALQKFLKGGWRDVPEGERWWEDALSGEIETRRARNLEAVKGVRLSMEGAMTTYV
ncbi:uncharacterized protein PHACADRAFT_261613 [Phanerochaete carnosa HHB-10118-sp]|uniref:Thioesterase domain-containing protein n=1 Tax=Phanerochaete carnosa (strain HHB-10118-sp) TaxID=650164 RepID=K5W1E2_PHACS|nr:uncharacterized protein PHACADRAFT_261613 [Phanerochaete carnosa HHB-10118-sp]EKM52920.1 hypothetical protein PHACADRAFT_261613 [Phanerochaete carnosa HHB-10118-sp]